MASGEARVSGEEQLVPNIRQVAVARAYVVGLEADRQRLELVEKQLAQATWETVNLGAFNRGLTRALVELVHQVESGQVRDESLLDRIEDLLRDYSKIYSAIWTCECGHSKYDHDENGCMYLPCRHICGSQERTAKAEPRP